MQQLLRAGKLFQLLTWGRRAAQGGGAVFSPVSSPALPNKSSLKTGMVNPQQTKQCYGMLKEREKNQNGEFYYFIYTPPSSLMGTQRSQKHLPLPDFILPTTLQGSLGSVASLRSCQQLPGQSVALNVRHPDHGLAPESPLKVLRGPRGTHVACHSEYPGSHSVVRPHPALTSTLAACGLHV